MKFYLLFTFIVLSSLLRAQEFSCGFDHMDHGHEEHSKHSLSAEKFSNSSEYIMFPIQYHVIRKADGTTPYALESIVTDEVDSAYLKKVTDELNIYYDHVKVRFYADDSIHYIDDDDYFDEVTDSDMFTIRSANNRPKALNIYFTNIVTIGGIGAYGGAYYGSSGFVFMNCIFDGQVPIIAHEVGHYFYLEHTAGCPSCSPELVDGSNCSDAFVGDGFCDTPADPGPLGIDERCIYNGADKDANGDSYTPDALNFMARTFHGCMYRFSPEQIAHMRSRINLIYNDFIIDDAKNVSFYTSQRVGGIGETIQFQNHSSSGEGITYHWEFEGGSPSISTDENPITVYSTAGVYDVKLKLIGPLGTDSLVLENYIKISNPDIVPPLNIDFEDNDFSQLKFSDNTHVRHEVNDTISESGGKALYFYTDDNIVLGESFVYGDSSDLFLRNPEFSESMSMVIDASAVSQLKVSFDYYMNFDYQKKYVGFQVMVNNNCVGEYVEANKSWNNMMLDLDSLVGSNVTVRLNMIVFTKDTTSWRHEEGVNNYIVIDNIRIDTVLNIPNYEFNGSFAGICEDDTVTFTDLSVGNIENYFWEFGVGSTPSTAVGQGPHKVHYVGVGERNTKLTTTINGSNQTAEKQILIHDLGLSGILGPDTVCAGQPDIDFWTNSTSTFQIWSWPTGVTETGAISKGITVTWNDTIGEITLNETFFDIDYVCFKKYYKTVYVYAPEVEVSLADDQTNCASDELMFEMNGNQLGVSPSYYFIQNNDTVSSNSPVAGIQNLSIGDTIVGIAQMGCGISVSDTITVEQSDLELCIIGLSGQVDLFTKVYPNPTNSILNSSISDQRWAVINLLGTEVMNGTGSQIDVSHLNSGLYIIQYESGVSVEFQKID